MSKKTLLATIPFPCRSLEEAMRTQRCMAEDGIFVDTRGDWSRIVEAGPDDFEDNRWYVVVHTGNLRGMMHDLEEHLYL